MFHEIWVNIVDIRGECDLWAPRMERKNTFAYDTSSRILDSLCNYVIQYTSCSFMSRHNLLGCASAENKNCKWEESWHPASGRQNDCFKLKTLKTSSEQLKWKFANFSSFFASAHVKLAIKLAAAAGVLCERSMKQTPIWLNENAFFIANQAGCDRIKASRKKCENR